VQLKAVRELVVQPAQELDDFWCRRRGSLANDAIVERVERGEEGGGPAQGVSSLTVWRILRAHGVSRQDEVHWNGFV
jgi:hypothetical protein